MADLLFKLEGQLLSRQNDVVISSGNANTDICIFDFDENWAGYIKTAVFYQTKENVSYAVLNEDGSCTIPSAALQYAGKLCIGIFGINGNKVLTSTVERVDILEGIISGEEIDIQPSDDIFLAIVSQYQYIAEQMDKHNITAQELKEDFNNSKNEIVSKFNELSQDVDGRILAQNEKIENDLSIQNELLIKLSAFDVIEMLQIVENIQATHEGFQTRMNQWEQSSFAIKNLIMDFTDKTYKIEDERITSDSLVDVYFSTETFSEAVSAGISVESYNGYVLLTCKTLPETALFASIIVKAV